MANLIHVYSVYCAMRETVSSKEYLISDDKEDKNKKEEEGGQCYLKFLAEEQQFL